MKTVSAWQLVEAYVELYPGELIGRDDDITRIFNNWLYRYNKTPEKAIATTNWNGKVTKALFHALKIKQPKTKKAMMEALT